jgi:AcrR family transcriptional regulator
MSRTDPPNLRERHKQERKERIYRAALRLFREKGFENTTVEEITEAAQVAKGTFFNYFPTKEAVLLYLGEQQMGGLQALAGMRGLGDLSATDRIKRLLRSLANSAEEDRELVRLMVSQVLRVADLATGGQGRLGFRAILALLIAQGQRAGELRADVSADVIAGLIEGVYFYELFQWCASPVPYALGRHLEALIDLLLDGLSPRSKGEQTSEVSKRPPRS